MELGGYYSKVQGKSGTRDVLAIYDRMSSSGDDIFGVVQDGGGVWIFDMVVIVVVGVKECWLEE